MTNGAAIAAAAAAAAKRRAEQEEELQTMTYSVEELARGWEFKILRANTKLFRKREVLDRVLAEESRAGWQLLEKLDDSRLRFKRPIAARAGDTALGVDPYRSQVGIGEGEIALMVVGAVLLAIALVAMIVLLVKG